MTGQEDTAGYVGVGWDRVMMYAFLILLVAYVLYVGWYLLAYDGMIDPNLVSATIGNFTENEI